jgi:hypothetical protein
MFLLWTRVTGFFRGVHRAVLWFEHDAGMKMLLSRVANFFASLVATDYDGRLYSDF